MAARVVLAVCFVAAAADDVTLLQTEYPLIVDAEAENAAWARSIGNDAQNFVIQRVDPKYGWNHSWDMMVTYTNGKSSASTIWSCLMQTYEKTSVRARGGLGAPACFRTRRGIDFSQMVQAGGQVDNSVTRCWVESSGTKDSMWCSVCRLWHTVEPECKEYKIHESLFNHKMVSLQISSTGKYGRTLACWINSGEINKGVACLTFSPSGDRQMLYAKEVEQLSGSDSISLTYLDEESAALCSSIGSKIDCKTIIVHDVDTVEETGWVNLWDRSTKLQRDGPEDRCVTSAWTSTEMLACCTEARFFSPMLNVIPHKYGSCKAFSKGADGLSPSVTEERDILWGSRKMNFLAANKIQDGIAVVCAHQPVHDNFNIFFSRSTICCHQVRKDGQTRPAVTLKSDIDPDGHDLAISFVKDNQYSVCFRDKDGYGQCELMHIDEQ